MGDTTTTISFMPKSVMIREIQPNSGIFSFDLSWSDIQILKSLLNSPLPQNSLARNPLAKKDGKFMTLAKFLAFSKNSTGTGILINIENAGYLAEKKSLSIVDIVSNALTNASYDKKTTQQVLIQSDDTSLLSKFNKGAYKRVLQIKETISGAPTASTVEIRQFADAVNIPRSSIIANSGFYLSQVTSVAKNLMAANISVHVSILRNELTTLAFDFLSDPIMENMEIATYANGVGVNGIITEYPATAHAYMWSPCYNSNAKLPYSILPIEPGKLMELVPPEALPPAKAPAPLLKASDVVDPPLPSVNDVADADTSPTAPVTTPPPSPSGQPATSIRITVCLLLMMLSFVSLNYH